MYKLLLVALGLVLLGGNLAVAQPQPPDKPEQSPRARASDPTGDNPAPPPATRRDARRAPADPAGDNAAPPPSARKEAGRAPSDPIGDNLFPPELIMRCADQIGLTDEQKDSVKAQLEKAGGRFKDLQQKLEQEVQALGALVKEDHPDTDKALAQLDKVLAAEREVKRVHIALMISLKNLLTPDQQAQIQEIRPKIMAEGRGKRPGGDVPQPLQIKMMQVQQQMKQLKGEGRDLAPVQQAMQQFEPLMREKKVAEAEAVLDEALRLLGEAEKK